MQPRPSAETVSVPSVRDSMTRSSAPGVGAASAPLVSSQLPGGNHSAPRSFRQGTALRPRPGPAPVDDDDSRGDPMSRSRSGPVPGPALSVRRVGRTGSLISAAAVVVGALLAAPAQAAPSAGAPVQDF